MIKDELIEKYILPFYLKTDLLVDNQELLNEWRNSIDFEINLKDFLSNKGWRNRVVASTVIGGLKLGKFIDQIFAQAKEMNEFRQAKSYAFALTNINNKKSLEFLSILAKTELDSDYSKKIQKFYQAGFYILNRNYKTESNITKEINELKLRIEKWKIINYA